MNSRETDPVSVVRYMYYPVRAHVLLFSVTLFEAGFSLNWELIISATLAGQ